jgi:uncharacterized phage protein (TIGR02218 family)
MRSPLWETSEGALAALLNSGAPLEMADLYTITLANGQVLRWTSADRPIRANGQEWLLGPGIERTRVKWSIGVSVDGMDVTLTTDEARQVVVGGMPLFAYISRGGFGRARVQLDRIFWALGAVAPTGALLWFSGRVAEIPEVDRYGAQIQVKSDLELLNVQVPRELYQSQCLRTVYDSECGLQTAAFQVAGQATGGSTVGRTTFPSALNQAAGFFDLGTLTWTSGPNAGVSRTVKSHVGGLVVLLSPLPAAVVPGDMFTVVPGCDGLQSTCSGKFNNLARFKGQPYIPQAETVL